MDFNEMKEKVRKFEQEASAVIEKKASMDNMLSRTHELHSDFLLFAEGVEERLQRLEAAVAALASPKEDKPAA